MRRVRYGADGGFNQLRNLAPFSKQGVDNYYGENRILATETTLPFYAYLWKEWLERAKTLVQGQMKVMSYLERALGRPHSLMLQLLPGDGYSTEGRVYISSVSFLNLNLQNVLEHEKLFS